MKPKKILSAILATVMLTGMMAACGGDSNSPAAPDTSGSTVSAEDASTQEEYTVKIMYFGDATTEDTNEVAAKLSELTKPSTTPPSIWSAWDLALIKIRRIWR